MSFMKLENDRIQVVDEQSYKICSDGPPGLKHSRTEKFIRERRLASHIYGFLALVSIPCSLIQEGWHLFVSGLLTIVLFAMSVRAQYTGFSCRCPHCHKRLMHFDRNATMEINLGRCNNCGKHVD